MELQTIQKKIYTIRGLKIMLDTDLAELYETETRTLKQAVRRNISRLPSDFMFELNRDEYNSLRSQIVTLKNSGRGQHSKYKAFAFTEQGVAMLASVLNNTKAIEVNIQIVRVFVYLRQYALTHTDLSRKLEKLQETYDKQFEDIHEVLNLLLKKDKEQRKQEKRQRIGFK